MINDDINLIKGINKNVFTSYLLDIHRCQKCEQLIVFFYFEVDYFLKMSQKFLDARTVGQYLINCISLFYLYQW